MLFVAIDFHASIYIFVWVLQGGKFNKQEFTLLKIVHTDQVRLEILTAALKRYFIAVWWWKLPTKI